MGAGGAISCQLAHVLTLLVHVRRRTHVVREVSFFSKVTAPMKVSTEHFKFSQEGGHRATIAGQGCQSDRNTGGVPYTKV